MLTKLDPIKVSGKLSQVCESVNQLEQQVESLRSYLDFGIYGKTGLRGMPLPEKGITYTKEIISYIVNQLNECEVYMASSEYKHRINSDPSTEKSRLKDLAQELTRRGFKVNLTDGVLTVNE